MRFIVLAAALMLGGYGSAIWRVGRLAVPKSDRDLRKLRDTCFVVAPIPPAELFTHLIHHLPFFVVGRLASVRATPNARHHRSKFIEFVYNVYSRLRVEYMYWNNRPKPVICVTEKAAFFVVVDARIETGKI